MLESLWIRERNGLHDADNVDVGRILHITKSTLRDLLSSERISEPDEKKNQKREKYSSSAGRRDGDPGHTISKVLTETPVSLAYRSKFPTTPPN